MSVEPEDICRRWFKNGKNYIDIKQPAIVITYNTFVGGVDLILIILPWHQDGLSTEKMLKLPVYLKKKYLTI